MGKNAAKVTSDNNRAVSAACALRRSGFVAQHSRVALKANLRDRCHSITNTPSVNAWCREEMEARHEYAYLQETHGWCWGSLRSFLPAFSHSAATVPSRSPCGGSIVSPATCQARKSVRAAATSLARSALAKLDHVNVEVPALRVLAVSVEGTHYRPPRSEL